MDQQTRLSAALNRLSAATSVSRVRAADAARAERNGCDRDERLDEVITRLEGMADELWSVLDDRPQLRDAA